MGWLVPKDAESIEIVFPKSRVEPGTPPVAYVEYSVGAILRASAPARAA